MSEEYRLSEEGIEYAKKLLKEKREARDFFLGLATNDVIKFMSENNMDPVRIILKILETDFKLREDGIDWEEYLMRLRRTNEGYIVEG